MTARPRLDATALEEAIGSRAPAGITREDRVRWLGEFQAAVLAGREPPRAAALFVASGIASWLQTGGDVARDHWLVVKPKSHRTPAAIWRATRAHQDERQPGTLGVTVAETQETEP